MRLNHIIRVKHQEEFVWTLTSDRGFQIAAHTFFTGLHFSPGSPCCGAQVISLNTSASTPLLLGCYSCRRPCQNEEETLRHRSVNPVLIAHEALAPAPNPFLIDQRPPYQPSAAELNASRMVKMTSIYGWLCFQGQSQVRGSYCGELLEDLEHFVNGLAL